MSKKTEAPEPTAAEKFAAFIESLATNHTITADVAGIIKHAIEARKSEF